MLMPSLEEYDALIRTDFNMFVERVFAELNGSEPYLDNFHIAAICAELEAVRRGESRRLAIALPPRSLKSIIVSVAFPAWLLGHNPAAKIICASYGQLLADKHARDCRQVMRSAWYRQLFPATRLAADRQAILHFETTAGGSRQATSVGGVVTGFGAEVIIVDDPTKPDEALSDVERARANAWARHTLFTRLNDKANGTIILVMQRLHEDDMIGHVATFSPLKIVSFPAIAQADEEYEIQTPFGVRRFTRLSGEALHEEREPLPVLEEIRRAIGSRFFSAQYLQMPAPPGGSMVKEEWFQRFDLSSPPRFDSVVASWDTANRANQLSDHSVCTVWGKKERNVYLLHVLRRRVDYPELKRLVRQQAELFEANQVLIEDCASGIQLIQELRYEGMPGLIEIKPKGDKVMRMDRQTAVIEAGFVYIPTAAPWLDDYLHELMMFPHGRFDDQVDSTSQALGHLFTRTGISAWLEYQREQIDRENTPVADILVNHPDLGMRFSLINGRQPQRADDGSFSVTEEEYRSLRTVPGIYLVED